LFKSRAKIMEMFSYPSLIIMLFLGVLKVNSLDVIPHF